MVSTNFSFGHEGRQQSLDFDRVTFSQELAEEARILGMRTAALSKKEVLASAQHAVRMMALSRSSRTATADDAAKFLADAGLEPLGNAAGSLFTAKANWSWEFRGEWKASERVSNHGHKNRIWHLKEGGEK